MGELAIVHVSDLHMAADANRLPSPFQEKSHRKKIRQLCDMAIRRGQRIDGLQDNILSCASHSVRAARHFASFLDLKVRPALSPNLFIVSGDVSTTGTIEDLREARNYLSTSTSSGWTSPLRKPVLGIPRGSLLVIPGNHDRYRGRLLKPNNKEFDNVFSSQWSPVSSCGRVVCGVHSTSSGEKLVIASADFSLMKCRDGWPPKWTGHVGTGRVYPAILKNLCAASKAACLENNTSALVWVIHFPPGFQGVPPELRLLDEEILLQAAEEVGVRIIFSGHTHQARRYTVGSVVVNCAGSLLESSADDNWGFSICRLEIKTGSMQRLAFYDYQFSRDEDWFKRSRVERVI